MRIDQLIRSGTLQNNQVVSYSVPHPDTQARAMELKKLVAENLRLVAEIKRKFGVTGASTTQYGANTSSTQ